MNSEDRIIERGMVFWVIDDVSDDELTNTYLTRKTRPWVVVSNNINNSTSSIITVVPVSTGSREYITHVNYYSKGKPQCILCEQIKTINVSDLGDYVYTVPDKVLEELNIAMANHLGIVFPQLKLDDVKRQLHEIVSQCSDTVDKHRTTWTSDAKKQFLGDAQILSDSELSSKYDIALASVPSYKSRFKKEIIYGII